MVMAPFVTRPKVAAEYSAEIRWEAWRRMMTWISVRTSAKREKVGEFGENMVAVRVELR